MNRYYYINMNHFVEVEFPVIINLSPNQLHKDMYNELEEAVKRKYSGIAHAKIGYIKRDSVRVVSKQIGKYEGSHLTGHMSFHLTVRCLATMPLKDMELEAIVTMKNDAGLVCKNFSYPYSLFVPNIPGDPDSAQLASINTNDSVRVRVIDSRLKAPALDVKGDRSKPEYWVICRLSSINLEPISRVDLPSAEKPTIMVTTTTDIAAIKEEQMRLSGGMFQNLQNIKDVIDSIRTDYTAYLMKLPDITRDPIIRSQLKHGENYVVGTVLHHEGEYVRLKINATSSDSTFRIGDEIKFNVPIVPMIEKEQLVLLTGLDRRFARKMRELDMWLLHVKYIINPNEMIHITNTYDNQLHALRVIDTKEIPYQERVISRAYYKMAEILHIYGERLLQSGVPRRIACLAESPGGFIQALVDHRLRLKEKHETYISSISMSPNISRDTWDDFKRVQGKYYADTISSRYGKLKIKVNLQSGDLVSDEDRQVFKSSIDEADLVTADGGFDRDKTSSDFEELDTAKLILAEVIMALEIQAQGGAFVLKIFDMATKFTVDLISILAYCYENVSIIKPKSSRPANSEKYVVCTGFKFSRDNEELAQMIEQLLKALYTSMTSESDVWGDNDMYYNTLLAVPDADIKTTVVPYNSIFMKKQTEVIMAGREYATRYIETGCDYEECMRSYVKEQLARAKAFHAEIF
jgi:23S rRNA U2552 (ribose-2'-O)-methylase RlmE/FtsJ/DNA-directed RNA polymerase subunit E'/Rpb7